MTDIHTLHILNKTPEHPRSKACRDALRPGDALLLIESAVLALAAQSGPESDVPVYALASDIVARGLGQCAREASLVDFPAMVDLTTRAQNVISW
ncbi:sulfurtransferase complex subunit TusB [Marinobacter sp. 1-4A]|uniref:sulfurtransferase complex subunit TusB n=1 Tax=unclassified Marinobacter TaxID=83889 RepID=UPI0019085D3D|nr:MULTISPECIES: sulfurtransferase complex subunit TusB [unclassified Marinobacter]MBK1851990.1 sulfurtransferase complex subunit TusB [Marinobacter sp. 1-4A]MCK0164094.1 sulfurtransferase complex subunit TusB [Marinobacter sp. S6332]